MDKRTITLIGVLILITLAILFLQQFSPNKSYSGTSIAAGNRTAINDEKALKYQHAIEIAEPQGFINGDNITIASLIGKKVILVDFWTYSCINCHRTIPYLNMWYSKYHDQGLEIIGIHTPEFEFEHNIDNVRQAVKKFGIQYPVVLDNLYATWGSYGNLYWPEKYLIDIDGFIVYKHAGEGDYDTTELKIQSLLKERDEALGMNDNISTTTEAPVNTINVDFSKIGSPEIYFGAERNQNLGNGKKSVAGLQTFMQPDTIRPNVLYLGGIWNFTEQYAETTGNNSIIFQYNARNVYFVASAMNPTMVKVLIDGKPARDIAGHDVSLGVTTVKDEQLYTLVDGKDYAVHTLELDIAQPGLRAYTFTFG